MVAPLIGAALVSGGASIAGGFLNSRANEKATEQNIAWQRENAIRQEELQREFAQNSLQWKAADALKAGIHPLYAMGASGYSYSPQSVGNVATPDTSMGSALASAGQDISRAMQATQSQTSRDAAFLKTSQDLQLTRMGLENELLGTQIAKQRAQMGPAMPSLNQKALIDGQPATLTTSPMGAAVTPDKIEQKADVVPETARLPLAGIRLRTNPNFADAEVLENRYGEHFADLAGMLNIPADMVHTYWPRNETGGYANYFKYALGQRGSRRTGRSRGSW